MCSRSKLGSYDYFGIFQLFSFSSHAVSTGDVIGNHIVSCHPPKNAVDVALTASIAIKLDDNADVINTSGAVILKSPAVCSVLGSIQYDQTTRCLTLTPKEPLLPSTKYTVKMSSDNNSFAYGQGYLHLGSFEYSFTTVAAVPIKLFALVKGAATESKVPFTTVLPMLHPLEALLTAIVNALGQSLQVTMGDTLYLLSGNDQIKLKRDRDVLQLKDGDVLVVAIKDQSSDNGNQL